MKKIIILSLLTLSFTACKKEKYTGSVSYWFSASKAHFLQDAADIQTLSFYVDGEFISTVNLSDYTGYGASAPQPNECNAGQFIYTDKMYKKETAKHSFKLVDQDNNIYMKGTFETKESECKAIVMG